MYLNLYNTREAGPLRQRRILRPPILRRISGGNDAAFSTAIRRVVRRIADGISGVYPPDHPAKLPGNLRAIARRLIGCYRAFARPMSRKFPPHCRRLSAGITGEVSGHTPVTFPSYARH
jgi:hypothetical protein